jgi:hypothetical protein
LRETVTGEDAARRVDIPNTVYGFDEVLADKRVADKIDLAARKKEHAKIGKTISFIENGLNSYPMKYVKQIKALAEANQTKLIFIYLPEYGFEVNYDSITSTYAPFGPVIFPPTGLLDNPDNWMDHGHLNVKGANEFSDFFSKEIERRVKS